MTRLCFGSFGTIIKQHCRHLSNEALVGAIVSTIDPSNAYAEERDASSRLLSCNIDFYKREMKGRERKQRSNVLQLAKDVDIKDVIEKFKSKVIPLIEKEKMESLIISLLFIIENDADIDVDNNPEVLHEYFGIKINHLDKGSVALSKVIKLSDFLANILLYIIKETMNNTPENRTFIKQIKNGGISETISDKRHILKLNDTQVFSPEYHVMKLDWDEDAQTLVFLSGKIDSIVMNDAIIEQSVSNGMLTETRLLTTNEEVEMLGSALVPVHKRSVYNKAEVLEKEKAEEKKSLHEEFISAISDYNFEEFIESEPLKIFTTNPKVSAERLESNYKEYINILWEDTKSQWGDPNDLEKILTGNCTINFDNDPEYKHFPYTDKFLTPNLLNMSKQLVAALTREIPPTFDTSDCPVHGNILKFKDKLKAYNRYLNMNLTPKGERFLYNYGSVDFGLVDYEEDDVKESDPINALGKFWDTPIEDIEIIPITDEDKDSIWAFHSTTRDLRVRINSLYTEIRDEIRRLLHQ